MINKVYNEFLRAKIQNKIDALKHKLKDKKVVLYGAGNFSTYLLDQFHFEDFNIIGIADSKFKKIKGFKDFGIEDHIFNSEQQSIEKKNKTSQYYSIPTINPEDIDNFKDYTFLFLTLETEKLFNQPQINEYFKNVPKDNIYSLITPKDSLLKKMIVFYLKNYITTSAYKRALPNFLVIGAQKTGSTSFCYFLNQHPNLHFPVYSTLKEPHYFSHYYDRGELWYRSLFPLYTDLNKNDLIVDGSTCSILHPYAPERIHRLIPHCKIILLLRNPVDRAISHYYACKDLKKETLPLEEAFKLENDHYDLIYSKPMDKLFRFYISVGRYIEHIRKFRQFFNKDQMLILSNDDFKKDPQGVLKQVYDYLGIQNDFKIDHFTNQNVGKYQKEAIPPKIYEYLYNYYKPYNKKLYDYLDRDFCW